MAAQRFPRCFLSCSLQPTDRVVYDWFRGVVEALEFEVVTGDAPEPRPPPEKIREAIRAADVFVAVLTRRDKIEASETWRPPAWVQQELGMAYEAGKPPVVFVESGVDPAGLEVLVTQYARFDRSDLGEATQRVVRYLVGTRNQLVGSPHGPEVVAVSRAIQHELSRMVTELMAPDTFADWPILNLAMLTARSSGRLYLLPSEVVTDVEGAYDAYESLRESLQKSKGWKSPEALLANPEIRPGKLPPGSQLTDVGKLADPALEKLRGETIVKVFAACFQLLMYELPPTARAKLVETLIASEGGGPQTRPPN